jgi:peptidoglycan/xylan/chitin deacetylase (PgdA/CDA1 family)
VGVRRHEIAETAKRAAISTLKLIPSSVRGRSRRRVVLCYHSIDPELPFASASPTLFRRHLEWLKQHCNVVRFDEVQAVGIDVDERPTVAITFDDGYLDNFTHAYPALRALELPATFFVTVGLIERAPEVVGLFESQRRLRGVEGMTWDQLRELRDAGFSVASHTYGHPNLALLGRNEAAREIRRGKEILEEKLQAPDTVFAYPFGKPGHHFTRETAELVREAGYAAAGAILFRGVEAGDDPFAIPRFFVRGDDLSTLEEKVCGRWDAVGWMQEHLPGGLARTLFPADFAHDNEGIRDA